MIINRAKRWLRQAAARFPSPSPTPEVQIHHYWYCVSVDSKWEQASKDLATACQSMEDRGIEVVTVTGPVVLSRIVKPSMMSKGEGLPSPTFAQIEIEEKWFHFVVVGRTR